MYVSIQIHLDILGSSCNLEQKGTKKSKCTPPPTLKSDEKQWPNGMSNHNDHLGRILFIVFPFKIFSIGIHLI